MVQLIVGQKGKGKTKYLLDKVNSEVKNVSGNIVYLDKSTKHMFELNNKVRLIDVSDFSFVNSDVEKVCLSIIIDKLNERKQLFFTTHNSDILDMQIPKHSFTFLKKNVFDEETPIKCISASEYLKRNTDSLKCAVENDLFCTAPELDKLYELMNL